MSAIPENMNNNFNRLIYNQLKIISKINLFRILFAVHLCKQTNKQSNMKTNHTQGKWVISHGANSYPTIGSAELHQPIATIHKIEDVKFFCEEAEANAKLIAAAPELLEQLQNMINAFEDYAELAQYKSGIFMAKQAIKKATKNI